MIARQHLGKAAPRQDAFSSCHHSKAVGLLVYSATMDVPHYWTADHVKRLLDALASHYQHQAHAAALIMWRTGLRVSEVLELEWWDLDYSGDPATLLVRKSKSGRACTVRLHRELVQLFSNWPSNRSPRDKAVRLPMRTALRHIGDGIEWAGLHEESLGTGKRWAGAHSLRHSAARHWLMVGKVPLNVVSAWLAMRLSRLRFGSTCPLWAATMAWKTRRSFARQECSVKSALPARPGQEQVFVNPCLPNGASVILVFELSTFMVSDPNRDPVSEVEGEECIGQYKNLSAMKPMPSLYAWCRGRSARSRCGHRSSQAPSWLGALRNARASLSQPFDIGALMDRFGVLARGTGQRPYERRTAELHAALPQMILLARRIERRKR